MPTFDPSLYLVTDDDLCLGRPLENVVRAALAGGVTMVQLREKACSTRMFIERARRIQALTREAGVPLIINDRLDVALAIDAAGAHIGQNDMPYTEARRLLGPEKIIGLSVESLADAEEAESLDVDYLGVSPIYFTPTKTDLTVQLGLEGLRAIRAQSRHVLVGIGGLNEKTIPDVLRAGADGIAVVSAICSAPDPRVAAQELAALIETTRQEGAS